MVPILRTAGFTRLVGIAGPVGAAGAVGLIGKVGVVPKHDVWEKELHPFPDVVGTVARLHGCVWASGLVPLPGALLLTWRWCMIVEGGVGWDISASGGST